MKIEAGISTAFGVTEDLMILFETMGVSTAVDLEVLIRAREALKAGLPGEPVYGMTPEAGLTKGFRYADGRLPGGAPLVHPASDEGAP